MPIDRLALILFIVLSAAGLTVWLATLFLTPGLSPLVRAGALVPLALFGWLLWRVITERRRDKDEEHYDGIEK